MRRNNNKALYEKIMRNVSRELKHALNESEVSIDPIERKVIDNITKF